MVQSIKIKRTGLAALGKHKVSVRQASRGGRSARSRKA